MIKPNDAFDLVIKAINAKTELATAEQKDLLANAKNVLADLKILVADQKIEIDNLNRKINLEKSLEFDGKKYWTKNPDGTKDGPFCPYCKDVEGRLVRMPKTHCSQCVSKNRHR